MSAWPPPAHPHGRGPVPIRWPRRIAGVLATVALFAVAIAMAEMIVPDGDSESTLTVPPPAAAKPKAKTSSATTTPSKPPPLTAAQKQARSDAVSYTHLTLPTKA